MNADQNPESLISALKSARIPAKNHEFIRAMAAAVGIREYTAMAIESSKPYVVATRLDGLPALRIYYGYTSGFLSADEAQRVSGVAGERPMSGSGPWFVAHPINEIRRDDDRRRDRRREAAICRTCGMQLALTGACGNCDD